MPAGEARPIVGNMEDHGYAAYIEECRHERARLAELIQRMEDRKLSTGESITIPHALYHHTVGVLAALRRTIAELDALIADFEARAGA